MTEVLTNIYHVKIPLMNNPLKEINSFFIKGKDRNLIIDTGFNQSEGREKLLNAYSELNFDIDKTDIFITHLHSDHSGLTAAVKTKNNKAYASKIDGDFINALGSEEYWQSVDKRNILMGIPLEEHLNYKEHPAYAYRADNEIEFTHVFEGDIINVGEYSFNVIDIAGHTPGHIGLHDNKNKIFFCGDHILAKITPNIITWDLENDWLGIFIKNLEKMKGFEIKYLFSSHRYFVENHKERVDELIKHHEKRLAQVMEALYEGEKTVYETASKMEWEYGGGNFLLFPVQQKWFASFEAFSHLQHFYMTGIAKRKMLESVFYYYL